LRKKQDNLPEKKAVQEGHSKAAPFLHISKALTQEGKAPRSTLNNRVRPLRPCCDTARSQAKREYLASKGESQK